MVGSTKRTLLNTPSNTLVHWPSFEKMSKCVGAEAGWARGLVDWHGLVVATESAARAMRMTLGAAKPSTRLRWDAHQYNQAPEGVYPGDWAAVWRLLRAALRDMLEALDTLSEIAPDFVRWHVRRNCGAKKN